MPVIDCWWWTVLTVNSEQFMRLQSTRSLFRSLVNQLNSGNKIATELDQQRAHSTVSSVAAVTLCRHGANTNCDVGGVKVIKSFVLLPTFPILCQIPSGRRDVDAVKESMCGSNLGVYEHNEFHSRADTAEQTRLRRQSASDGVSPTETERPPLPHSHHQRPMDRRLTAEGLLIGRPAHRPTTAH